MTADRRRAGLLMLALVVAACGGSSQGPTATTVPVATSTARETALPTDSPAPTSAATALASHVANPTPEPSAASSTAVDATSATSDEPFPNADEAILLAHVDAELRDGCARADQFYADEIDSVSCGGDSAPFVDYTLFASVDELRAAFNDDVAQSESQPTATGTCAAATYQSTYTLGGEVAGRIQCTTRTANGQLFRVIEWTREELRILAYLSSATATWTEMIAFWRQQAGPTG